MLLGLFVVLSLIVLSLSYSLGIDYQRQYTGRDHLKIILGIGSLRIPINFPIIRRIGTRLAFLWRVDKVVSVEQEQKIDLRKALMRAESPLPKAYQRVIKHLARFFTEITHLKWEVHFSTGDSYLTALSVGALWSAIGGMLGYLQQHVTFLDDPDIDIRPSFTKPGFEMKFHCIFRIQLGHIIVETLRDFYQYLLRILRRKGIRL